MINLPVVLIALSSLTVAASEAADSASEILTREAEAHKQTMTLQSEFVQRIEIPALEREEEGHGIVYQKKPNYFLMKFDEPKGDMVVADGEYFWMYYPSVQPDQVIRTAIDESAEGVTLGGQFLANPTERYVATYVRREMVGDRSAFLLSLVPRYDAPYTLIRVWIDADDYLVRKFEVHERNETVRTLTLRNVQAGLDLPEELFRFSPPQGVQVFTR